MANQSRDEKRRHGISVWDMIPFAVPLLWNLSMEGYCPESQMRRQSAGRGGPPPRPAP